MLDAEPFGGADERAEVAGVLKVLNQECGWKGWKAWRRRTVEDSHDAVGCVLSADSRYLPRW